MQASVRLNRTCSLPTQRAAEGEHAEPTAAIQFQGVCKQFGDHVVVDNAELLVARGQVTGLTGPGGSGKTTVMSMATGLLPADEGDVRAFGIDACEGRKQLKPLIGVVPDAPSMPERVTGRESLICTGMLRGLNGNRVAARADEVLEMVGLSDVAATLVSEYTTGMRKRLCLAAALLHDPELLVLDEPFEGVDVESASLISSLLRRFADEGGAVLLSGRGLTSSHGLFDEVFTVADGTITAYGAHRGAPELAAAGA